MTKNTFFEHILLSCDLHYPNVFKMFKPKKRMLLEVTMCIIWLPFA